MNADQGIKVKSVGRVRELSDGRWGSFGPDHPQPAIKGGDKGHVLQHIAVKRRLLQPETRVVFRLLCGGTERIPIRVRMH